MIAGDGLIQLALLPERIAEIVVRLGVIGVDSEGLVIAGDGLIQLALTLERIAKVVVRLSVIGLDG